MGNYSNDLRNYNATEQEIVYLLAACHLIDEMVNYQLFKVFEDSDEPHIIFHDENCARLFNIWLVDFLTLPLELRNYLKLTKGGENYVNLLAKIYDIPNFSNEIKPLQKAINRLQTWLAEVMKVENVWFPSIGLKIDINIERQTAFYITGNTTKHNFLKLNTVVKKLKKALVDNVKENGNSGAQKEFSDEDCLKAIPNFQERFHSDILGYLASELVELLNAVRWGIHEYLSEEYGRSYRQLESQSDLPRYEYAPPDEVNEPFVKHMHWELMNLVRSGPPMNKFTCGELFKKRYRGPAGNSSS